MSDGCKTRREKDCTENSAKQRDDGGLEWAGRLLCSTPRGPATISRLPSILPSLESLTRTEFRLHRPDPKINVVTWRLCEAPYSILRIASSSPGNNSHSSLLRTGVRKQSFSLQLYSRNRVTDRQGASSRANLLLHDEPGTTFHSKHSTDCVLGTRDRYRERHMKCR